MTRMPTTIDERLARIRKVDPEFAASIDRVDALLASAQKHGEEVERLEQERERLDRRYGRRFILIRF